MFDFKSNKGFTLIELLVTIAIIGLLATISMVGMNYARQKAKIAKAQHEIDQIHKAIDMLVTDSGFWPNHQQYNTINSGANNELCGADINAATCVTGGINDEVAGIMLDDSASPYDNWSGPYMLRMPMDAWSHEYFFDTDYLIYLDGTPCYDNDPLCIDAVVVGSYGPDGIGGLNTDIMTAGNEDDIIKIIK